MMTATEYAEILLEKDVRELKLSVKSGIWTCAVTSEDGRRIRTIVAEHQEGPEDALLSALSALRELPKYHPISPEEEEPYPR